MTSYLSWLGQGPSLFGRSGRGVGFRREFDTDEEDEATEALKCDCATGRGNSLDESFSSDQPQDFPKEGCIPPRNHDTSPCKTDCFPANGSATSPNGPCNQPVPLPKAFWHCALPCGDEALPEPSDNPAATGTASLSRGSTSLCTPEKQVEDCEMKPSPEVETPCTSSVHEAADTASAADGDNSAADAAAATPMKLVNQKAAHEVPLIALTLEHQPLSVNTMTPLSGGGRLSSDASPECHPRLAAAASGVHVDSALNSQAQSLLEITPRSVALRSDPAVERTLPHPIKQLSNSADHALGVDSPMVCVEVLPDQLVPPGDFNPLASRVLEIKGDLPVDPPTESSGSGDLVVPADSGNPSTDSFQTNVETGMQPLMDLLSVRDLHDAAVRDNEAQPLIELEPVGDSDVLQGDPARDMNFSKDENLIEFLPSPAAVSSNLLVNSPCSVLEAAERQDDQPDADTVPVPKLASMNSNGLSWSTESAFQKAGDGVHQQGMVSIGTQTEHGALDEALSQIMMLQARLEASESALREERKKNEQCRLGSLEQGSLTAHLGNG